MGRSPAASSTPLDDCSPTSSVWLLLLGSWVAMFLRVMWKAATVAVPLPPQKSSLLPTSYERPVVSSVLSRTLAKVAVLRTPAGGSAAVAYCAYRFMPGATSHTRPMRPVVGS